MKIKTSIIIPTRLNIPYLSRCLEALCQTCPADTEVIVVSNGSQADMAVTLGYVGGVAKVAHLRIISLHCGTPGFAPAVNMGLKIAQGEQLVVLNDDTVPAPGWLQEIERALEAAQKAAPEIKWGYAGPRSNNVMGFQCLDAREYPLAHDIRGVEATALQVKSQAKRNFIPVGVVSGFCLFMTRECYKAVGPLETFGLGGFEDNDFCLRAHEAGFLGLIACTSYVFHVGHATLDRFVPGHQGGVEHAAAFMAKWYRPREKRLCVAYRVKIDDEENFELFQTSLLTVNDLADEVVVLDDRSKASVNTLVQGPGWKPKMHYVRNADEDGFNEARDRARVIKLAQETGCDWIWSLDHDEIPSPKVTRKLLQRLMNPPNPQIKGYSCPLHTFWRGKESVRLDGPWGQLSLPTFFKNDPAWGAIHPAGDSPFHCRRIPTFFPWDLMVRTMAITVEHYGYTSIQKSAKKQAWYREVDTVKNEELIGTPNYEHLTDETNLKMLPYSNPRLSVLYLVRNEQREIVEQIRRWSTYADEMVVVDTGSRDQSASLCEKFGVSVLHYRCCEKSEDPEHLICDFSAARNFAIDHASGDYILFLDPDEQVDDSTLQNLDHFMMEGRDGYMCEIHNLNVRNGQRADYVTHLPRLFRNRPEIRYDSKVHESLYDTFQNNPNLSISPGPIRINHFGFLKTSPNERLRRNQAYFERLVEILNQNPEDTRALFALAVHLNEQGETRRGDQLLAQALNLNPAYFSCRWEIALRMMGQLVDLLLSAPPGQLQAEEPRAVAARKLLRDVLPWVPTHPASRLLQQA